MYIYREREREHVYFLLAQCLYISRFLKKRVSEICHDLQCCRSRNFASVPIASTGLGTGRYIICLQSWEYVYIYIHIEVLLCIYVNILCIYI